MTTRRDMLLGTAALLLARQVLAQGQVEQGVRRARGSVQANSEGIITGPNSEVLFVTGRDAVMVRSNSSLSFIASGFRLVTGAVLAVFSPGQPKELRTPTATIGIRGTAVYLEIEPGRTYVCTCYGEAELASVDDPASRETVRTRAHEQPRYIMAGGAPQMITAAPVINHTDTELALLEGLVGRQMPYQPPGTTPRY
jgi:hypothetical protein